MKPKSRRSQPRIAGVRRDPRLTMIHPLIHEGIKMIAEDEGKSESWVVAQIVGDYLGVDAMTGRISRITSFTRRSTRRLVAAVRRRKVA
jgi:hypothetical protein